MKVYISKEHFDAVGEYENGKLTVKKGSTINSSFASYIKGISLVTRLRKDPNIVNSSWEVVRDCEFPSPSTAAQFVMGQSRDGFDAWKTSSGESLGKYLESKGLRERKRRKKEE